MHGRQASPLAAGSQWLRSTCMLHSLATAVSPCSLLVLSSMISLLILGAVSTGSRAGVAKCRR